MDQEKDSNLIVRPTLLATIVPRQGLVPQESPVTRRRGKVLLLTDLTDLWLRTRGCLFVEKREDLLQDPPTLLL